MSDIDLLDGLDVGDKQAAPEPKAKPESPRGNTRSRGIITEPLFFDLETVPDFSRKQHFGFDPLPELPEFVTPEESIEDVLKGSIPKIKEALQAAPGEWIDELTAAEQDREKPRKGVIDAAMGVFKERETIADAEGAQNKKMSVTPEFCRIVAFGFAIGDEEPEAMIADTIDKERAILIAFWDLAKNLKSPLVGYNILGFDLPVIFVRSCLLGVEPTRRFDLRPWGNDVYDLMKKRFAGGGSMKMKDLAGHYQIPVPAGDFDGSQVLQAVEDGLWDEITTYVKSDVVVAQKLYQAWHPFFA
ncbi:hypothetical protein GYB59_00655 [bacterium]|nr:hypothetical protein [bacterium]